MALEYLTQVDSVIADVLLNMEDLPLQLRSIIKLSLEKIREIWYSRMSNPGDRATSGEIRSLIAAVWDTLPARGLEYTAWRRARAFKEPYNAMECTCGEYLQNSVKQPHHMPATPRSTISLNGI